MKKKADNYCDQCKQYMWVDCKREHGKCKSKGNRVKTYLGSNQQQMLMNNRTVRTEDTCSQLSLQDKSSLEESISVTMATAPSHADQLDSMLTVRVKSSNQVNIKLPQDKTIPGITSCAFLPNGELLLADCRTLAS